MEKQPKIECANLTMLFKKNVLRVPDFQRPYAWMETHVDRLFDDIANLAPDRFHPLGVVTLLESNQPSLLDDEGSVLEKVFIVDGQQRLATICMLVRQLCERIDPVQSAAEISRVKGTFLNAHLADSDSHISRLTLGVDDADMYSWIMSGKAPASDVVSHNSHQRLVKASDRLKLRCRSLSGAEAIEMLRKLRTRVVCQLSRIYSESDAAYAFKMINARGLSLTNAEMIKNLLLAQILTVPNADARSQLRMRVRKVWTYLAERERLAVFNQVDINRVFGVVLECWRGAQFDASESDHAYHDAFEKEVCSDASQIFVWPGAAPAVAPTNGERISETLTLCELAVDVCTSAWRCSQKEISFVDDRWLRDGAEARDYLRLAVFSLMDAIKVSSLSQWQFMPMLVAAARRTQDPIRHMTALVVELEKMVMVQFVVRAKIQRTKRTRWKSKFEHVPIRLREESAEELATVVRLLRNENADGMWRALFSVRLAVQFSTWPGTKLLLAEYGMCEHQDSVVNIGMQLEHVMPQVSNWPNWDDERHAAYVERPGNMLLLSGPANSAAGNETWKNKCAIYRETSADSRMVMATVAKYENGEWSASVIDERTQALLKFALVRWGN